MSDKHKNEFRKATCGQCRREFVFNAPTSTPDPSSCGDRVCIARATWTESRWRGQLRMALARRATGQTPSTLDRDAFRRFPEAI